MPTKFTLEIDLGNAAMTSPREVARALRELAIKLYDHEAERVPPGDVVSGGIRDINGNKVGTWSATWPEREDV